MKSNEIRRKVYLEKMQPFTERNRSDSNKKNDISKKLFTISSSISELSYNNVYGNLTKRFRVPKSMPISMLNTSIFS